MVHSNIKKSISNIISEITLDQSCHDFDSVIQQLKSYKRIFIYGAGGWGKSLQKILELYSIDIHAFFDQRAGDIELVNKIPVYNSEHYGTTEKDKKESLVIVAVRLEHQESVVDNLRKSGYVNCRTMNGIWYYGCWSDKKELFSLVDEKENILKCSELWADQRSMDIYYGQIACYLSRQYNISNQIDKGQYFPDDIKFEKGYSRFVDCGAHIGDTVVSLIKNVGKITSLVAIEPDTENFRKLSSRISQEKKNIIGKISLYPCGIWSSSKKLAFDDEHGPSCHVSESGNTLLECISLDDILHNFIPTFIKMDVEGAEVEAIKGARCTISKHKPGLAISVYHRIEHLWKIPLLLKSIEDKYKFYLRSYEHFNQETVLYAV